VKLNAALYDDACVTYRYVVIKRLQVYGDGNKIKWSNGRCRRIEAISYSWRARFASYLIKHLPVRYWVVYRKVISYEWKLKVFYLTRTDASYWSVGKN
jgi:hypothetical protein